VTQQAANSDFWPAGLPAEGHGCQVHGASSETALANLAYVLGKPYEEYGLLRLPRGSDRVLSHVIFLRDSVTRPPSARPRVGDGISQAEWVAH